VAAFLVLRAGDQHSLNVSAALLHVRLASAADHAWRSLR
jgi:hypothetical protein